MMVVGFAFVGAGVLLLYWMYVGGKGNTSGAPSGFGPGAGAGGGGGGGGGGGVW